MSMLAEVLELCCFEWSQNKYTQYEPENKVLELCCFEWSQNQSHGRCKER